MKHNPYILKRNQIICKKFDELYKTGMPTMRIYAELAEKFDLTERQIQRIIYSKEFG